MAEREGRLIPADFTWPGFEALPESLKECHRRFFQAQAQRNPLTLREYRRAFLALYTFMQEQGIGDLTAFTPQHLEAFQHWCYRRYRWAPGNVQNLLQRTLNRIGNFLQRLGLLQDNPFAHVALITPPKQEAPQLLSWFRAIRQFFRWLKARGVTDDVRWQHFQAFLYLYGYLKQEGLRPPTEIDSEKISRFGAFLATHPVKSRRHPLAVLAPSTQRVTMRRIRRFIQWVEREGFTASKSLEEPSPFLQVGPTPAEAQPPAHGLTEPQKSSPTSSEDKDPDGTARLQTAIQEFLAYAQTRYATETRSQYTRSLHHFMEWIGARPKGKRVLNVDQLTMEVLSDYLRWLNVQATHSDGSPLTQPEKEARLYPLKAFLRFCYRKGLLPQDLRRFVVVPRREHKILKRLLTEQEMACLLEAPSESTTVGIRDRAMLELSYSGLRAGELLGLKLQDVDLEENRIFIREAKGDKDRVVPMTHSARYWMSRWLSRRKELLKGRDPEVVFLTGGNRPLARRHFARNLERYVRQAQLPVAVSPHDLRRITATHLVVNGAPIRHVQALLGHESLKVTTKYLRLTDAQIKTEYNRTHPSSHRARHATALV